MSDPRNSDRFIAELDQFTAYLADIRMKGALPDSISLPPMHLFALCNFALLGSMAGCVATATPSELKMAEGVTELAMARMISRLGGPIKFTNLADAVGAISAALLKEYFADAVIEKRWAEGGAS